MSAIVEHNVPPPKIICNTCRHYIRSDADPASCAAFDEIPRDILTGRRGHDKPIEGQKGSYVYEPEEG